MELDSLEVTVSLRVVSVTVIMLFHGFGLKKLVGAEDAPSAPLQGEDKYPRMLMALGLMENSFHGASNEKSSH